MKMVKELQLRYTGFRKGFNASGIYEDGKLTVLKGSTISKDSSGKIRLVKGVMELRENKLVEATVDENGIVLKSITFKSPSTAAQFVGGNRVNGLVAWKDENGKSLKEIIKDTDAQDVI